MTPEAARQLVLDEGLGQDGIVVLVRMGADPGPERMNEVVEALNVLCKHWEGVERIDRQVAYAMFALANHVEANLGSWTRNGRTWRARLVDQEFPALLMAVESVFAGEWAE